MMVLYLLDSKGWFMWKILTVPGVEFEVLGDNRAYAYYINHVFVISLNHDGSIFLYYG